jgi:dTDP-glucose 4,6-dehydratase
MKRLLVTGGLGFIGSYFVKLALERGYHVINVDKKTYAARKNLGFEEYKNYEFLEEDICTLQHLPPGIDFIVNFAAESHVDNSITANKVFFESNIGGVYNLLELVRAKDVTDRPVLLHISTDEVYGTCQDGSFHEKDRLFPSSPYSATKAAADELIFAWGQTYGIQYMIARSCNNYGFGQHPEKLFAKTVDHVWNDKKMTVHGNGSYKREWIYAGDNCEAILTVLEKGTIGEVYNISSNEEHSVLDVVRLIIREMGKDPDQWIDFVENRSGQDLRYSVHCDKVKVLGWKPVMGLAQYIPEYLALYRREHGEIV